MNQVSGPFPYPTRTPFPSGGLRGKIRAAPGADVRPTALEPAAGVVGAVPAIRERLRAIWPQPSSPGVRGRDAVPEVHPCVYCHKIIKPAQEDYVGVPTPGTKGAKGKAHVKCYEQAQAPDEKQDEEQRKAVLKLGRRLLVANMGGKKLPCGCVTVTCAAHAKGPRKGR